MATIVKMIIGDKIKVLENKTLSNEVVRTFTARIGNKSNEYLLEGDFTAFGLEFHKEKPAEYTASEIMLAVVATLENKKVDSLAIETDTLDATLPVSTFKEIAGLVNKMVAVTTNPKTWNRKVTAKGKSKGAVTEFDLGI